MTLTKTTVVPWLVAAGLIAAIVIAMNVLSVLVAEPSPIHGATAVGTAADGSLIIRSQMCESAPEEVEILAGAPNASDVRVMARYTAATEVRADLHGTDTTTTLTIGSGNTEAAQVTLSDWQKLTPGTWLVTDVRADGSQNRTLATGELHAWAC